jgi:hypothetical protein
MKCLIFALTLMLPSLCIAELEPNNNSNQANSLGDGVTMRGQLSSSADVDWYALTIPGSSKEFTLQLKATTPKALSGQWTVVVYNSSADTLAQFTIWESDTANRTIGASGTVHVAVYKRPLDFATDGEYQLTAFASAVSQSSSAGSFSGIWQTDIGRYVSVHQVDNKLMMAVLGDSESFRGWEAMSGTISGLRATARTMYGYVDLELDMELTSATTIRATQKRCFTLTPGYTCEYPNGSIFTATKIF